MDEKSKDMETEVAAFTEEDTDNNEDNMVIKFKKPFLFEKKEYTEIDLSVLDDLTASDMVAVNKIMQRTSTGIDVLPEVSVEYACNIAAKATKLPVEFFMQLPPREAMKVKTRVMGFLFG